MFNTLIFLAFLGREQPPSCGCVLKLQNIKIAIGVEIAAAFVRLCVETTPVRVACKRFSAAAFVRLCVETPKNW